MQIVIDIPKEKDLLDKAIWGRLNDYEDINILIDALKNGTVLPENHGRLIEITPQIERELWTFSRDTGINEMPFESAIKAIDNAPTVLEATEGEE